jgi:hypothetical protein
MLATPSTARGQGLRYDLRFDDDSKTRFPTLGEHTVNLFARVAGDDTDHTNDGLGWNYVSIASLQLGSGSGAGAVAGAITTATRRFPFDLVGRDGSGSDFNGDGFGDWGSIAPELDDQARMFAHVAPSPVAYYAAGSDAGYPIDPQTWEFPVATFTVDVTGLLPNPAGQTQLEIIAPTWKTTALGPYYATYRRDGFLRGVVAPADGIYGSSVAFVVPEPHGFTAVAAAAALAQLSGRRRQVNDEQLNRL